MTLTERMMGSYQASQGSVFSLMGSAPTQRTTGGSTSSDFDKILSNRLSGNNAGSYMNRDDYSPSSNRRGIGPETVRTQAARAEAEPRYKTFNEAHNHNKQLHSSVKKNDASRKVDNGVYTEKTGKGSDKLRLQDSSTEIIQVMAHMFGLDMMDLRKVLDEAGINLESLDSMQSISEISADLSQLLGLTGEQQITLEDMLNLAGQLFELPVMRDGSTMVADDFLANSAENSEFLQASKEADIDAALLEAYPQITDESLLEQLSAQIKSRLNEYAKMLEEGNGFGKEELENLLLPLLEKSAMKGQIQPALEEETVLSDIEGDQGSMTELSTQEAQRNAQSNFAEEGGQELSAKAQPQPILPQTPAPISESQPQPVFAALPHDTQLVSEINGHGFVSTPATAAKQILGQIIDEAQVILTPEKSEMVMELQPESLGKLSLKVVTEKGIVMAKFVAENQQVKEVLESNMQLLKDALQKQGMEVQGFNVSVRQDTAGNGANSWQYDPKDRSFNHSNREVAGIEAQYPEFTQKVADSNPYIWESSTINLTA